MRCPTNGQISISVPGDGGLVLRTFVNPDAYAGINSAPADVNECPSNACKYGAPISTRAEGAQYLQHWKNAHPSPAAPAPINIGSLDLSKLGGPVAGPGSGTGVQPCGTWWGASKNAWFDCELADPKNNENWGRYGDDTNYCYNCLKNDKRPRKLPGLGINIGSLDLSKLGGPVAGPGSGTGVQPCGTWWGASKNAWFDCELADPKNNENWGRYGDDTNYCYNCLKNDKRPRKGNS